MSHIDEFVSGFDDYAAFLRRQHPGRPSGWFRRVEDPHGYPTHDRFYYMLLQRLRDHRTMHDGVDVVRAGGFPRAAGGLGANDYDATWPLHRAERAAVVELNVPHFVMDSDGGEIRDAAGTSVNIEGHAGSGGGPPIGCAG